MENRRNKKKPRQFARRTFRRFYISYLIVIILLLGVDMLYYFSSYSLLRQESLRANELQASRFASVMDAEIIGNLNTLIKLENSAAFVYCLYDDNYLPAIRRNHLEQLRGQLSVCASNNLLDLFIYFKKHDLVVSSGRSTATSRLYYNSYFDDAQTYEDWAKVLDCTEYTQCAVVYSSKGPCLAITHTLPTSSNTGKAHAVAVCTLQSNVLSSFLVAGGAHTGAVAVYSMDGSLLLTSDNALSPDTLPQDAGIGEYSAIEWNGETLYISVTDSESARCRYVSILQASVFTDKTSRLLRLQIIVMLVILAGGSIVAYALTRRNLQPLEKTVKAVADKSQIQWHTNAEDEFDYLINTVESTVSDKVLFQQTLDKKSRSLRQTFLYEALNGALSDADVRAAFSANRLACLSSDFAVLLLRGGVDMPTQEEFEAQIKAIANGLDCICHVVYALQPEVTLLLNVPEGESDAMAVQFGKTVWEGMADGNEIAVSRIMSGGAGLRKAYRQATELLDYAVVYGHGQLFTPDMLEEGGFHVNSRFYDTAETLILQALRGESPEEIPRLPKQLMDAYSDVGVWMPAAARGFLYDMRNAMTEMLSAQIPAAEAERIWNAEPGVADAQTLPEFSRQIEKCVEKARALVGKRVESGDNLTRRVDEYLETHYDEVNLNLAALEPIFGVSGAYLSEKYKQTEGLSIPERLTGLRVEKICRLLVETDLPLEAIGAKVGMGNISTLMRAFKKITGVTPGAYRKAHKGI